MSSSFLTRSPSLFSRLKRGTAAASPEPAKEKEKSNNDLQRRNSALMRLKSWSGKGKEAERSPTPTPTDSAFEGLGIIASEPASGTADEPKPATPPKQRKKPRKLRPGSKASNNIVMEPSEAATAQEPGHEDVAPRVSEQDDSELSSLPADDTSFSKDESSIAMQQHHSDEPSLQGFHSDEGHSIDEGEMKRQLGDLESSFLPETVPVQQGQNLGVDDTYLELGKPGRTPPPAEMIQSLSHSAEASFLDRSGGEAMEDEDEGETEEETDEQDSGNEPDTPAGAYKTPALGHDEDEYDIVDNGESSTQNSVASPSADAARRTHSRQVSTASVSRLTPMRAKPVSISRSTSQGNEHSDSRPSSPSALDQSFPTDSTVDQYSLLHTQDAAMPQQDLSSLPGWSNVNSLPRSRITQRPSYLKSRQASQRSSASSVAMRSDFSYGSDSTLNADYALQTGGAIPSSSLASNSRPANGLSRLPSLGSVASYMTRDSDSTPSLNRGVSSTSVLTASGSTGLGTLSEERRSHSPPETPRAIRSRASAAPTDTVLAQHVQNIQVPDTVARDFRAMNQDLSPEQRRPASSGGVVFALGDRPRRTLTLKEQNSKIDKLTKENFDLKLKIHFLDQALQSRSDDGVKELIDKNVQFQTDLANERKETQTLRRKVRELERKAQEQADAFAEAQQHETSNHGQDDDDPMLQAEMHEEILYLRQQLDYSENTVTTLREDVMTKELEKRKMAEHMRSMAGSRGEDTAGMKETIDMWQDLLNAETGRREQAEEDIRRLREELSALRIENASPAANRRKDLVSRASRRGYEASISGDSEYTNGANGAYSEAASTLVEQLKHENAELRKDLGAQTSMLTSRNRERERLQQEIEDLKLLQRKSDGARSVAGESIFERSVSRAHQRASSRASDQTRYTQVTEAERDDWETKEGQLRDQNAELKIKFQDLERSHNQHLQYISVVENDFQEMEQELEEAAEDLQALQRERDEALQAFEDKQAECDKLENEAVGEIDTLEKELEDLQRQLEDTQKKHQKAQVKLEQTTDGYRGLQGELRDITQSVMNLEDEKQANVRTIQTIELQIAEAEDEIQKWEQKCKELNSKNRKLEITQESLHSEITFLREEQEGDKIKIGELEDALNAAQQTISDEQEKLRELEDAIMEEREQRDVLENKSKEEVQKVLDDLNTENGKTKDEVRKLRRGLSTKEVEASGWKQRLDEMEQSLRHALGDVNGTKQSLLANIERLQRDVESTANELDRTKMDVADKDRLLRHRDGLLESTSLESRRLSDLLDRERNARKHDMEQWERQSRGQATSMRTLTEYQSRNLELETAFSQDKRKMAALEQQFREQLHERNILLFALWNRLSTLCGQDWAIKHSSVDGQNASVEVIARNLAGFNKNIISAIKTVEGLLASFKVRVRSIEKDLWKDYQTLEHNLDMRIRRMDHIERAVKDTQTRLVEEASQPRPVVSRQQSSKSVKSSEEISKLKGEVKFLKAELKFHRQHPSAMAQQMLNHHYQLNPDHARSSSAANIKPPSPARQIVAQLLRHHSTSAVEQLHSPIEESSDAAPTVQQTIVLPSQPVQPSEQRWVLRLKELERKLKLEREGRVLDREGAKQRLIKRGAENEELRLMLEHEKTRREMLQLQELQGQQLQGQQEAASPSLGGSEVQSVVEEKA